MKRRITVYVSGERKGTEEESFQAALMHSDNFTTDRTEAFRLSQIKQSLVGDDKAVSTYGFDVYVNTDRLDLPNYWNA